MASTGLVTLSVPRDYGYVLLTATATFFLANWHGMRTGPFRRAAGIPLPHVYFPYDPSSTARATSTDSGKEAKAAYLFNCAQRAQANFLESYPSVLAALLVGGLHYPIVASAIGVFWAVNRVLFAVGYTNPDAEKGSGRRIGLGHYFGQLGLYILAGMTGYNLLRA